MALADTKVYLHIRSNDPEDTTKHLAKKALRKLNASISLSLSSAHVVVFKDGSDQLHRNAVDLGIPVVVPEWLFDCKEQNTKIPIAYPYLFPGEDIGKWKKKQSQSQSTHAVAASSSASSSSKKKKKKSTAKTPLGDSTNMSNTISSSASPKTGTQQSLNASTINGSTNSKQHHQQQQQPHGNKDGKAASQQGGALFTTQSQQQGTAITTNLSAVLGSSANKNSKSTTDSDVGLVMKPGGRISATGLGNNAAAVAGSSTNNMRSTAYLLDDSDEDEENFLIQVPPPPSAMAQQQQQQQEEVQKPSDDKKGSKQQQDMLYDDTTQSQATPNVFRAAANPKQQQQDVEKSKQKRQRSPPTNKNKKKQQGNGGERRSLPDVAKKHLQALASSDDDDDESEGVFSSSESDFDDDDSSDGASSLSSSSADDESDNDNTTKKRARAKNSNNKKENVVTAAAKKDKRDSDSTGSKVAKTEASPVATKAAAAAKKQKGKEKKEAPEAKKTASRSKDAVEGKPKKEEKKKACVDDDEEVTFFTPPGVIAITGNGDTKDMVHDVLSSMGCATDSTVWGRCRKPCILIACGNELTPKVLFAVAAGIPIATPEWVMESLSASTTAETTVTWKRGQLLSLCKDEYFHPFYSKELRDQRKEVTNGECAAVPTTRAMAAVPKVGAVGGASVMGNNSNVLKGKVFYLLGTSDYPSNAVFAELIKLLGGDVVRNPTIPGLFAVVVMGSDANSSGKRKKKNKAAAATAAAGFLDCPSPDRVPHLSPQWIVDTCHALETMPIDNDYYRIRAGEHDDGSSFDSPNRAFMKTKPGPQSAIKYGMNQWNTQQLFQSDSEGDDDGDEADQQGRVTRGGGGSSTSVA